MRRKTQCALETGGGGSMYPLMEYDEKNERLRK